MVKVSIMMPVYNLENYIERSINSINNQTLKDIELICVNDGSTDNSLNVLKEFEEKYDFIKIFTQDNKGAGPALNKCIDEATGEYIAFLDADDIYVDNTALEKLYNQGSKNNADMVAGNLKRISLKGDLMDNYNYDVGNYVYFSDIDVISPKDYGIPWAFYKNIYKRTFLNTHNIRFPPYKRGVDPVFLAQVLVNVSEIHTVPVDLYGYNYSIGGGFNNKLTDYEFKKNHLIAFKSVFDILESNGFEDISYRFKKELITYLTNFGNENDMELFHLVYQVYGKDEHYFDDYYDEFMLYKIKLLLNNINDTDSYNYSKNSLKNTKIWENNLISKHLLRKIFVILCSSSFEEYEINLFKFDINELKIKNKNLTKETKKLKKKAKKINNEKDSLLSSTSWKITKPIRNIKRIFK